MKSMKLLLGVALAVCASAALAQTIKIGFITSYSGLNGNLGPYMERAVRLYIKEHQKELPPGVKIELITRDDTGPNPDKAKQLAQELIVRDKVNLLAGVIFTPNAMAMAPLATEAKVPFVIMNAGTAVITTRSPYIARTSFTLWQSSFPLGQWASKKFKTAYTLVSDFGPGHDAETAFTQAFKAGGGKVIDNVRVPLQNPDWAAYMQRVKDAKPDFVYCAGLGVESVQLLDALKKIDYAPPRHYHLFTAPGPLMNAAEGNHALAYSYFEEHEPFTSRPGAKEMIPLYRDKAKAFGIPYPYFDFQAAASGTA